MAPSRGDGVGATMTDEERRELNALGKYLWVWRVQDSSGRGPWRPGFSRKWCDADGPPHPPPFYEEFGPDVLRLFHSNEWGGCGCRTKDQLAKWFTTRERYRLMRYGFDVVYIGVDRIIAESENQVVFARTSPLAQGAVSHGWRVLPAYPGLAKPPEGV